MRYLSTKTYGHDLGLSCAFRQWRARSHCRHLHGYALAFTLTFEATHLDEHGWVLDFGALRPLKERLCDLFDHTTAVAQDDPELALFQQMHGAGMIDLVLMDRVGCEAFASLVADIAAAWLLAEHYAPRVWLVSVECREHGANSAVAELT